MGCAGAATLIFIVVQWLLVPSLGNLGLWIASQQSNVKYVCLSIYYRFMENLLKRWSWVRQGILET